MISRRCRGFKRSEHDFSGPAQPAAGLRQCPGPRLPLAVCGGGGPRGALPRLGVGIRLPSHGAPSPPFTAVSGGILFTL